MIDGMSSPVPPIPPAPSPVSTTPNPAGSATSAAPQATSPVVMQSKQIGRYLVEVINDKCIGAASCVAIAPKVFKLNEANIAEVISQEDDDDNKLLAAQSCPTAAIIVTDTTTGQRVWPPE